MKAQCSNCDHLNEDDAVFCSSCHHFLAWDAAKGASSGPSGAAPGPTSPAPASLPRSTSAQGRRSELPPGPPAARHTQRPGARQEATNQPVGGSPADLLKSAHSAIDQTRQLAERNGRSDLVQRIDGAKERLRTRTVTVAVIGEFKKGKSTLVNALVQRAVCPVDADIVTAVPTLLRYGEQETALVHEQPSDDSDPVSREHSVDQLATVMTDDLQTRVRSIEVRLPHRMLRSGLSLLDTPGVGGLESIHGQLTLASLNGADGALFVTDASQELTAPEMEFLQLAQARCPSLALVVTKTDLHPQWRRIVELNRTHLANAGLAIPVLPVSSVLRMEAVHRPALNEESGFGPLVVFLARKVMGPGTARLVASAAHEVDFVAEELAKQSDAERLVLRRPDVGDDVVDRLNVASGRTEALSGRSASWQQLLNDGVQDLVADIEHDLQSRLRRVVKEARDRIEASDPLDTWTETGAWLRKSVAAAGVANRDLLVQRAEELTQAVAAEFNLASGEAVDVQLDLVTRSLEELELPSATTFRMPGGRLGSLIVTARTTALVPMLALSLVNLPFIPLYALAGGALLATTGVGAKLFMDESRRHRSYRQAQARAAIVKYVEEAGFEMNKETRDSLRLTQRRLRDEFQSRAQALHASANGALTAARRAKSLDPEAQAVRSAQLEQEVVRLGAVRRDMQLLSIAGGRGG